MTNTFYSKNEYTIQIDNLLINLFLDLKTTFSNAHLTNSLHSHFYAEVFACKSGKVYIEDEKRTTILSSGEIAIVPFGLMHLRTPNADSESEWANIGFICSKCISRNNRDLYAKISPLINKNEIIVYKNNNKIYDVLKNINSVIDIENEPSLIIEFVSELTKLSNVIVEKENDGNKEIKQKIKNMDRLLKLDYFINHRFMYPLTNKEIANELHLGERQLSRLVLKHYGTTLHTILTKKRITVAAKLLTESSDTIENIALSVGFNGKMSFYREFKRIYGMTPAQYRNKAL